MMMKWYRSLVGLVLVAIATLLVSCSSGPQAKPPEVYTPEKIAEIQIYADRIGASESRLIELAKYIAAEDWTNVDNFIHGPLGELRQRMNLLASKLLPADKPEALALSEKVAKELNLLSSAATERNYRAASQSFQGLQSDLGALLDLVPEA